MHQLLPSHAVLTLEHFGKLCMVFKIIQLDPYKKVAKICNAVTNKRLTPVITSDFTHNSLVLGLRCHNKSQDPLCIQDGFF